MGQECLGRDAVVEAAGTGGNVWTLSVLPKFGKKFLLRFFSAGGNGGTCLHPAKMSAKSFCCAIFQLAGTLKKGGSKINIPA
jgi:hypothetical protein